MCMSIIKCHNTRNLTNGVDWCQTVHIANCVYELSSFPLESIPSYCLPGIRRSFAGYVRKGSIGKDRDSSKPTKNLTIYPGEKCQVLWLFAG